MTKKKDWKKIIVDSWKYLIVTLASSAGGLIGVCLAVMLLNPFVEAGLEISLFASFFWLLSAWLMGFTLVGTTLMLNDAKIDYYKKKNESVDPWSHLSKLLELSIAGYVVGALSQASSKKNKKGDKK